MERPPTRPLPEAPPRGGWPARFRGRGLRVTAGALVAYGVVVLVAEVGGGRSSEGPPAAPSFSLVHLALTIALAAGVLLRRRWAWWGTAAVLGLEVLLLLPLLLAAAGGWGTGGLLEDRDLALLVLETGGAVLVLLLLWTTRREIASDGRPSGEEDPDDEGA